ncbi:Hypothetical_protein [Hexamita inflata]|uniref:Hypothetical_protein n=1 Tax=Hexamita inflata TaxID=28002 RepID=A0AA86U8C4_9EUKA|nr:Hypothetical protein HINF_LOCUS29207 [Hexamita inflata]CAI9947870.1 Hypothetical protein HINF_LOCUS35515 [Hexamita inflata]
MTRYIIVDNVTDEQIESIPLQIQTQINAINLFAQPVNEAYQGKCYYLHYFILRKGFQLDFNSVSMESALKTQLQDPLGCDKIFLEYNFINCEEQVAALCFTQNLNKHDKVINKSKMFQ